MIRRKSFSHGWWYHYRLHEENAERHCCDGLAPLHAYLHSLFETCPDEKFLSGPRCSRLRFPLASEIVEAKGHPLCSLARLAGTHSSAHTEVELALLAHDPRTVAVEVPLWLDEEEHELMARFEEAGPLSGHIDVLRIEDGKVWVWDYKPKAKKEKYAATQVYAYAVMLSRRSGVPLEEFRCGWFDEEDAYVFKPK